MKIKYNVKTLEDIICYWVESQYISSEIDDIAEYTDEVAELYETENWLHGIVDKTSPSIMEVSVEIDGVSEMASDVRLHSEKTLAIVLEVAIQSGEGVFQKYKDSKCSEHMDEIIESLSERFDEIYDYNKETQVKNFYKVLSECLDQY